MLIKEFERQVKETPDNIAVKTTTHQITYEKLSKNASIIASKINGNNNGNKRINQDIVALLFEQGADMITSVLGTLKAQQIFVPLSPDYPKNRLLYMLENCGAMLLITNNMNMRLAEELKDSLPYPIDLLNIELLDYSEKFEASSGEVGDTTNPNAYILYTSGSTGVPKGILQSCDNVHYYANSYANCISLNSTDRMTLFSSFSHDAAIVDIFSGLLRGACLYPQNPRQQVSMKNLALWLMKEEITVWHSIPTLYRCFANELTEEKFPHLRMIVLGGENVLTKDINLAKQHFSTACFMNLYGQSEASFNSYQWIAPGDSFEKVTLGDVIEGTELLLVDEAGMEVEPLKIGEIVVVCPHVALGYWRDEEKTISAFSEDEELGRIYWTGDLGRLLLDGRIEYIGRRDFQLKVRGYRVELGEIENKLITFPHIKEAVVVGQGMETGETWLQAYITANDIVDQRDLRNYLAVQLPDYMIPAKIHQLAELPRTANGKTDRGKLLEMNIQEDTSNYLGPQNEIEEKIADIWQEVLKVEAVDVRENFFDVGGDSILLIQIHSKLQKVFPNRLTIGDLFVHTTVEKLAREILKGQNLEDEVEDESIVIQKIIKKDIAIIGMALNFPRAKDVAEFEQLLSSGYDAIGKFPESRKKDVDEYIKFQQMDHEEIKYYEGAFLEEIDKFDYQFFKMTPKEASLMDPNQRLFLETAWRAIEDAGYGGKKIRGSRTGVYLGYSSVSATGYRQFISHVEPESLAMASVGNTPPIIASRISYLLDLRGPSMLIDTACSASLVSIHTACQSIVNGECDMALAGGIKIHLMPLDTEEKLGIESSDHRAKTFDDTSDGTGMGEGVAVIMLKPLHKALEEGDQIYAVIKGSAINQDGSSIGLTAPNAAAQEDVIVRAWNDAGIDPSTITYIEAHGTGTKLGDPIEIEGITRAFRKYTENKQFCGIGSVKTNIGHLGNAAGIAGLIKAVLSLKYKKLFPSLHFNKPNRNINFEETPVYVNDRLRNWESTATARRCGVSSFGISGTNCHMVLEEAPQHEEREGQKEGEEEFSKPYILTLSAKSQLALEKYLLSYIDFLSLKPTINLQQLTYTANTGREHHPYRNAFLFNDLQELMELLAEALIDGSSKGKNEGNKDGKIEGNVDKKADNKAKNKADEKENRVYYSHNKEKWSTWVNLCCQYVEGEAVDWEKIYGHEKIRKISLPTYPFVGERCWLDVPSTPRKTVEVEAILKLLNKIKGNVNLPDDLEEELVSILSGFGDGEKEKDNQQKIVVLKGREDENYTLLEEKLAEIWGVLLGYKTLHIKENFYELGGDSILALRIVNQLNKEEGLNAEVKELLANPTIEDLARIIEKGKAGKGESIYRWLKPIDPVESEKSAETLALYEASSSQKRIFTLHSLNPQSLSYNMPTALYIEGRLDVEGLKGSFKKLIQRQEALRTTFTLVGEKIIQRIHNEIDFELKELYSTLPREEILRNFVTPFNLEKGPLLRGTLVYLGEEKYFLLLDLHHIISDGASMGILVKDIMTLYQGLELPPLKLQYRDYSFWQKNILKSQEMKGQEEFWLGQFKEGMIPVLNLPTDFQRPAVKDFQGHRITSKIEGNILSQLRKMAKENNTTLYTVLLTAYKILLYRLTGQEDIVVGSPIHGRGHLDLENIIGIFINTLALRSYPTGAKSVRDYLQEVRDLVVEAQANQLYPFEDLVDQLKLPRDMGRNPLFDTMFVMQNIGVEKLGSRELQIKPVDLHSQTSKFDLHLSVIEGSEGLELLFEYDTKLFIATTINRFIQYYQRVLLEILTNYGKRLSEIEMIPIEERRLIESFNPVPVEYPRGNYLHREFENMVVEIPSATAITFGNESLTYQELNERANGVARELIEKGIEADFIVAICLERSLEMMIGILGILKAGGAYLPISPDTPQKRIRFMLEDSKASIVLTQKVFVPQLEYSGLTVIALDEEGAYLPSTENPEPNLQLHHLAYVIYTSGSTGNPKGVMIEHAAIINRVYWMQKQYPLNKEDRVLQKTPYTFDVSVWELLWWGIAGASVCFLEPKGEKDPQKIVEAIEKNNITTIHFVPSMLNIFLEYVDLNQCQYRIGSLKQVFASGEALGINQVERFKELLYQTNGTKLANLYGPTEAAVDVSYFDCDFRGELSIVPIGKPIDNIKLYVVDKENNLQPIGVPGELCIAGVGLARGYLNRPELTKEKFCNNPFELDCPMYRTGDLVRWLEDGNLEYLGRMDFQVKIRGYRIELGEIEGLLLQHEAIRDAVVVDRRDEEGNKYLCGYIVPKEKITIQSLKNYLKKHLPDYMIPTYFVEIAAIPLSSNGKVDRRELPPPCHSMEMGTAYVAPENEIQREILEVWQGVLGNPKIGIRDDFFTLGGDSFKALRVINQLQGKITLTDLFQYPTIQQIWENILKDRGRGKTLLTKLTRTESENAPAVVCIPYGGGSGIIYKSLADTLSRGRLQPSLYAVTLPGHDIGDHEAVLEILPDVAKKCVEEIINNIKKPVVIYGHCVGAALTLEIARLLKEAGHSVEAVVLGAVMPVKKPLFGSPKIDIYEAKKDDDLHKFLQSLGGFDQSMEKEELSFIMKSFRHDVIQMRDYFFNYYPSLKIEKKLQLPIYIVVGEKDPLTRGYEKRYKRWADYAEKVNPPIVLEKAGHYFLKSHAVDLAEVIEGVIKDEEI